MDFDFTSIIKPQLFRETVIRALLLVYHSRYRIELPSAGRTRLTKQAEQSRYVFHAAYASPVQRGNTSVLEDVVPLRDIPVQIQIPEAVRCVRLIPEGTELAFAQEGGILAFTLPCVTLYQGVEIGYEGNPDGERGTTA